MIWSHHHWDAVFKRSEEAKLKRSGMRDHAKLLDGWSGSLVCVAWKPPKLELFDESSKRTATGRGGGATAQLPLRLPSACLPGIQSWNPNSCWLQTRGRLDGCSSSSHRAHSLCVLRCTPGGCYQEGDLIPYSATPTLASVQHGNRHSQFVTVKSNIRLLFDPLSSNSTARLFYISNS